MGTLAVVGLGYVGLPLAVQAAQKGYKVIGIDLNSNLVSMVNKRQSPYVNDDRFAKAIKSINEDSLTATTDIESIEFADVIVICVPTPTENNTPDLSLVLKASEDIANHIHPGQLIILESTVSPGITRDLVLPAIEGISGLKVGADINLAHCPERIDPGNDKYFVGNLNRVVGGITKDCTIKAADFYISIIDARIVQLGTVEEAEFVKSWENSHRNVMIALANSAAIICDGLEMNVDRVLEGLQSKVDQFGLGLAKPGIGPGGHCIPEDIHYVIKKARQNGIDTRFLDDAAELNDKMPRYAVYKLARIVRQNNENLKDLNVALLGLAYKPDIADLRRSPSIEVGYQLLRNAKNVIAYDPYITNADQTISGVVPAKSLEEALEIADVVFIGTAHKQFSQEIDGKLLSKYNIRYVLDGRNCLDDTSIITENIKYAGIGK